MLTMIPKHKMLGGGLVKKSRAFRMCLNLNDYHSKTSRYIYRYEPHGNCKSKTYSRYTKSKEKGTET